MNVFNVQKRMHVGVAEVVMTTTGLDLDNHSHMFMIVWHLDSCVESPISSSRFQQHQLASDFKSDPTRPPSLSPNFR